MTQNTLDSLLSETRTFEPNNTFTKDTHVNAEQYALMQKEADRDPEHFWANCARDLVWQKSWERVLEWEAPFAKWFQGGKLNVTDSCLKRHAQNAPHKKAIIWESEAGDIVTKTYEELYSEVKQLARSLRRLKINSGDRVVIYMPLVPEALVAMHACAHVGAVHSVVFGGFSADSLQDRINDCGAKLLITADGGYRKGKVVQLKVLANEALKNDACKSIEHVLVLQQVNEAPPMNAPRDIWWHDAVNHKDNAKFSDEAESVDAEHPLFILYTSGTTGKPKGIVHTTGGYLTQTAATFKWVFDYQPNDIYWCTADVGWITGHSYVAYGPLSNGATVFMYEGAPTHPTPSRFWEMIERHRISILYTAPTAIRTFMRLGDEHVTKHDLSSLRLLGSVGEPINPEAWMWYHEVIGGKRCPIVDTWWQTETGAIMISPLPGAVTTTPGSATRPLFGISPAVLSENAMPCDADQGGNLVIKKPWPSMARGIWGDSERFIQTYWSKYQGYYLAGDSARKDKKGNYWIMGRNDDVVNISGHRLGTMEVESVLVAHESVTEAAVVARPDDITGQAIVAFVTTKESITGNDALKKSLEALVIKNIGKMAKPAEIRFTNTLPKTRSGKIMRRLLRELATSGKVKGDTTTLEDFSTIESLQEAA